MNTEDQNRKADNDEGARPNILYSNMLDQMRYFEALEFIKEKDVLDIACGVGWGSYLMSKSGAKTVKGIDLSENALMCAEKYYKLKNINYILGDALRIPLDSESIDVIVSLETFEHIENVSSFVNELHRVARNNSLLILSTPNGYCCKNDINRKPENPYHFQEYLRKDIENIFSQDKWEIVSYKGQNPMKKDSEDIKKYRRFIFLYWKFKKYELKYGLLVKIPFFIIRRFILAKTLYEPAYKDSCMPKDILDGNEPSTHFYIFKCIKLETK